MSIVCTNAIKKYKAHFGFFLLKTLTLSTYKNRSITNISALDVTPEIEGGEKELGTNMNVQQKTTFSSIVGVVL